MSNNKSTKYLTESLFFKEIQKIHILFRKNDRTINKLFNYTEQGFKRLDKKIDDTRSDLRSDLRSELRSDLRSELRNGLSKITLSLIETQDQVKDIKKNMATKAELDVVIDHVDHCIKRIDVFSKKMVVHDHRLNELEPKVAAHHKRLAALEAK